MNWDAEGIEQHDPCGECGSTNTVTYHYEEGYSDVECRNCGYSSELEDIAELSRYRGDLLEADPGGLLPPPIKRIKA
jgi:Zn ribbon nucleic-acid-binding protein